MTRVTLTRAEAHVSDFGASSDPLVNFAVGSSAVAVAITVALSVWVIYLRWRLLADRRRGGSLRLALARAAGPGRAGLRSRRDAG